MKENKKKLWKLKIMWKKNWSLQKPLIAKKKQEREEFVVKFEETRMEIQSEKQKEERVKTILKLY